MLNSLTSYQFEDDKPVRVVMVQGEPWFVANDIAAVLGYRDAANMVRLLDEDERGTHIVSTPSADQNMTIISESGLYAAIFKSRRDEAQRFRRWVTGEVLPTLRRTGRYELPPPPELPAPAMEIDVARLTAVVGVVREARQIWGPVKTRIIWEKLGLPTPIVEAAEGLDADPLVEQVATALSGESPPISIEQLGALLGMTPSQLGLIERRRLGAALRLLGWLPHVGRVHGAVTKLYAPVEG